MRIDGERSEEAARFEAALENRSLEAKMPAVAQ